MTAADVRVIREATHCRESAVVLVSMRVCACQAFKPGAVILQLLAHHAVKVQLVLSMPQSICDQTFKDILNFARTCRASNQPCLSARKIMTEGHRSDLIWVQENIVRVESRPWPIQELVLVLLFRLCSCFQYYGRSFSNGYYKTTSRPGMLKRFTLMPCMRMQSS